MPDTPETPSPISLLQIDTSIDSFYTSTRLQDTCPHTDAQKDATGSVCIACGSSLPDVPDL